MGLLKKLFGLERTPPEELRSEAGRDSCLDVVRIIRERVSGFSLGKAMVVVLLEGCRIQLYFFDGIAHVSWSYNNQVFSTNFMGLTFLKSPPTELILSINAESLLPEILKREFGQNDMNIAKLWKLDSTAPDYTLMKILHDNDVSIRISFDAIPYHDGLK
jgi:hypothetical protein